MAYPPHSDDQSWGDGVVDRRSGLDRREVEALRRIAEAQEAGEAGAGEASEPTGLERRRGPGRRRTDFARQAEEGEMSKEQFLFLMAIEAFKKSNGKAFPAWSDVLEVIRLLGYRKTAASELKIGNAEDWREKPDAPSGVREITRDNWSNSDAA